MISNMGLLRERSCVMFGFKKESEKKEKKDKKVPTKELREVIFERYNNSCATFRPVKVFTGSENDCAQFVRAQAIEGKQLLAEFEDEVIVRVYKSRSWSRIEVLDLVGDEDKCVDYYSATYRII